MHLSCGLMLRFAANGLSDCEVRDGTVAFESYSRAGKFGLSRAHNAFSILRAESVGFISMLDARQTSVSESLPKYFSLAFHNSPFL